MPVDLSGEITAIATAVLAVFAIVTAWYARRAFLKQSQEVSAIERQVKDQEKLTSQQAELLKVQSGQLDIQHQELQDLRVERRRAQARLVSVWPDLTKGVVDRMVTVQIENNSPQPIRHVRATWDPDRGERQPESGSEFEFFDAIEPGGQRTIRLSLPPAFENRQDPVFEVVMLFQDAVGIGWRIHSRGQLDEEPVTD